MAEVFLCATGQLTAASRRELKRAGVTVVEVEDPSACQFIRATYALSADDMLWAACDALKLKTNYTDNDRLHREKFALNLIELIEAAHARPEAVTSG